MSIISAIKGIIKRSPCLHRWYVINRYSDEELEHMAEDPRYDPSLQDCRVGTGGIFYEKVCLDCKKYIDEITLRYKYHLEQIERQKERQIEVEMIVAQARGPERKIWER